MSKKWLRDRKRDHYHKMAKSQGYRSRAAFKLFQINDKYHIIKPGMKVLDLGAAPGGWSQVAREIVGEKGSVLGVDLEFIRPLDPPVVFITGDITTPAMRTVAPTIWM